LVTEEEKKEEENLKMFFHQLTDKTTIHEEGA